jgi:hypothetical protein
MHRRWIAVESARPVYERYALPRLTKVVAGTDHWGITPLVAWKGGGSFRVAEVASSPSDSRVVGVVA